MRYISAGLVMIVSAHAYSAGVDCGNAATNNELLICSDSELIALDKELAGKFSDMTAQYTDFIARNFGLYQQEWLNRRDRLCDSKDVSCLIHEYHSRIEMLNDAALADLSELEFNSGASVVELPFEPTGFTDSEGNGFKEYIYYPYTTIPLLVQLMDLPMQIGFSPYNTHHHPLKFEKDGQLLSVTSCNDYFKAKNSGYDLSLDEPYRLVISYLNSCEKIHDFIDG